jgi:putative PEP-CTERM system TPR-repeat lipoprotein
MKLTKIALYICLALASSSCSEKKTVADYLAKAKHYQAIGKVNASEIELKNAVKLDLDNAEARFQLGRLYLFLGAELNAIKELEKARLLKYDENKLLPLLARAYVISKDFSAVIELADSLDVLSDEDKVKYLSYRTLSEISLNQPDLAKKSAHKSNSIVAENTYSILTKAYVSYLDGNIEKAKLLVKNSLLLNENNPEALMFQGQVFSKLNDDDKASESYKKYLTSQPRSKAIYLILAETLLRTDNYLEAEKYADIILQEFPNQPVANYVKAVIRYVEKDYPLASQFADRALWSNYKSNQLKLVTGASAFYLKNYEKARKHLGSISELLVSNHPARKIYAMSLFQLGLIDDISEALEGFTPKSETDQKFLSMLSSRLYSVGANADATKLLDKTSINQNSSSASIIRHGLLMQAMNDTSGVDIIEQALTEAPEMAKLKLALSYAEMQSGNYDKALELANSWLKKSPDAADGYNMKAAIYNRQGNVVEAKKSLLISLEKEPKNLFAITELIKLNYQHGDLELAQNYANKAIELSPDNVKVLRYYYVINHNEEALEKIAAAYKKSNENILLNVLYMEALAHAKNFDTFFSVSSKISNTIKTPKRVWQLRVVAYQRLRQGNEIQSTLKAWIEVNPYHIEPVFILANIYSKSRQLPKSLAIINKALEKHHADNLDLKMVKMQLLLDNFRVSEAKTLLIDLKDKGLDDSLMEGIHGRIALLEGDFINALPLLQNFYKTFDSTQNAILLTITLQNLNKKEQAIKLLESHLSSDENAHKARELLANLYIESNKDLAIKHYQILTDTQPLNISALNNLAWLLMEEGELDKALSLSEKAYLFSPKVAKVADTYSQILLRLNRDNEALIKSKEAYNSSQGKDINIALNYIDILMVNNRFNEAKSILSKISPTTEHQKDKITELKEREKTDEI